MFFNRSQTTVYTEKESAQIENALEESFGVIQKIYHEIVSDDVHLDIATVAETADMPFQKLFTIGMGAKKCMYLRVFPKKTLNVRNWLCF